MRSQENKQGAGILNVFVDTSVCCIHQPNKKGHHAKRTVSDAEEGGGRVISMGRGVGLLL